MIRPSRALTRVFPDRNYRAWTEFWARYSLYDGLEMVWSEVILVSKVWTMVWKWSDQRSNLTEKSDQRRLRAPLDQIITSSSALGSDQKCFWMQLSLIRDHFECLIFSLFYWEMLALPRGNNKPAFWSQTHLKFDSSDQKKGVHLIAKAGPLQRTFLSTGDHDVSYGKLSKLIHWVRKIH